MACEGEILSVELSLTRNSLALKHVISFMRKRKALLMGDDIIVEQQQKQQQQQPE